MLHILALHLLNDSSSLSSACTATLLARLRGSASRAERADPKTDLKRGGPCGVRYSTGRLLLRGPGGWRKGA